MAGADRLIEIFTEAMARLAGAERERYLADSCGSDSALKEHVLSLLEAHDEAGDYLKYRELIPPSSSLTEKPGDRIGRYKLLEQIGEGGCGIVYLADQEEPVRRRVALKVLKLGMDTRQVIARFEAERQALAMMDHPNIAKVLDGGGTDTGRPFFVMELVRGVRITEFSEQALLSTEARLRLFIQVCQAIQHAHQKGIIHRDLKPSNILVTVNDGAPMPKVIDFGIAKATGQRLTENTLFTRFHAFIGTPAYTSPEQAEMSSVDIDTRSDIYSLGVLLYELLTGHTPFDGEQLLSAGLDEMRRIIRDDEPLKPSTRLTQEFERICESKQPAPKLLAKAGFSFVPGANSSARHGTEKELISDVQGDLDWIVMKCLEKDRSRRYETASALAADIQRHLDDEPITARPPSGMYLLQKLARRNRGALIAAVAVLLALLVAVLSLATSNARIRQERNQKDTAFIQRGAALEAAHASEQQAREQLFLSLQIQAQARRNSRQVGQRLESLAALAQAARIHSTADLRDNAIGAMAVPDIEAGPVWPMHYEDARSITYDSRYQHSARLGGDGIISIRTIPGDVELQRLVSEPASGAGSAGSQLRFSPDGRFLARLAESGRLWVWQWETGELVLQSVPQKCSALAFSPDSRRLAVGQEAGITCFDLNTGEKNLRWETPDRPFKLEFHPDNHRIAAGYFDSNVVSIYNSHNGVPLAELPMDGSSMTVVAWHPEGNLLATGGSDARIQIWDAQAWRRIAILEGHVQHVSTLLFHPGGDLLVSGSWDNVLAVWQPSPGRLLMKLPSRWVGLSRNGPWAGVIQPGSDKAQLWGIVPSQEYFTFLNTFAYPDSASREGDLSANGALLALATSDGVRLWDVPRGREVARLSMNDTTCALFRDHDRELLTCGPSDGLRRWAMPTNTHSQGVMKPGPFRSIQLPFSPARITKGSDENMLAVVGEISGQCVIVDLRTESVRVNEMSHRMASYVALGPNAERVATSGWHSEQVKLWETQNGKLLKELIVGATSRVFFTPDNQLLVARANEFTFYTLDSLAVSRRLPREFGLYPGHVAFTVDGKLMALEMAPGVIHLKQVASGRTVAKLEDPLGDVSTWMSFTPDGTQLVVVARYAGAIHRWDLQAIRKRLKAMKLDWDWPEFPALEKAEPSRSDAVEGVPARKATLRNQPPPGTASAAKP
jgi:serine/threonine protein kinase/WD40 repeat protein